MKIISAYPCLGKTTIANSNEEKFFDREFFESRTVIGMSDDVVDRLFSSFANIIELQYQYGSQDVLFITDDERLLKHLRRRNIPYTIVLPDVRQNAVFNEYKKRVIERFGIDWWNRVLESDIENLKSRISIMLNNESTYKEKGVTLKLIDYLENRRYIEDVVDLGNICS
jgi:hypothetical protein